MQVADEVRAWLARRRRSANRAAKELGWSQPYMSQRLNGDQPFDLDDLDQLAALLDVPVTAFFDVPPVLSESRVLVHKRPDYQTPHLTSASLLPRRPRYKTLTLLHAA